jgi:aerotaxis receptor
MRENLPVTDIEYALSDDTMIVSKTDLKGKLTYFNDQFIEVSGFSEGELFGQPHNIVRHPDMPPAAFEDLWTTLKAGKPWTGAVKNRRKNGDYYWVLASATPQWENGQITGYMSIRTKLPADQRDEAERVYALMRENKAHRYKVVSGIIRRRTVADHLSLFNGTLKARLTTMAASLAAFMLIIGMIGIMAVQRASTQMQSVYNDRVIPLTQLFDINNRMQANIVTLYKAAADGRAGRPVGNAAEIVNENLSAITATWGQYTSANQTPQLSAAAESYAQKRRAFAESGLKASVPLLEARRFDELSQHLEATVAPLFADAKQEAERLVALQAREAKAQHDAAASSYWTNLVVAVVAIMLGISIGGLLGLMTIRAVSRPLNHLIDVMSAIAKGVFTSRVRIERDDEAGIALRNLQAMQAQLGYDRVSQADIARRTELEKKAAMHKMAEEFQTTVGGIINTVSTSSAELETAAGTLMRTAETTQSLSTSVATASEQASSNVRSVATASEEMAASVGEISNRVQESTKIAGDAVRQAEETNVRITELSQAASRIGDVVKLITAIAEQTNLLALNATIEAARAGEAGRGFAVVATEVKALAAQTAKATEEIGTQISSMQAATEHSVTAIKEIGDTIGRISEITSAIATAVEEQGTATGAIARNVQQAAQGTAAVAGRAAEVNRGAGETGSASSRVLSSAQSLASESNHLKIEVNRFLASVRAA